jgi:hypothetical protein
MVDDQGSVSSGSKPSDHGASSSGGVSSSYSTQTTAKEEPESLLVEKETRYIRCSRAVFLGFIIILGTCAGIAAYFSVTRAETLEFENEVRA